MVRCPLDGVTSIVIDMGPGGDAIDLATSGAAPPVEVREAGRFGSYATPGQAAPALTSLSVQMPAAGGDVGATGFRPGELQRFEVTGGAGADGVTVSGVRDVRVSTGGGDDRVSVAGVSGSAEVLLGAGDDFGHVRAINGATSTVDGGDGHDLLESDDAVRTAFTCGAGIDTLTSGTADQAGAGCGVPVLGLERFTGFTTCVDVDPGGCSFAKGKRTAKGTINAARTVLTIRGVGRLPRAAVVSAGVGTLTGDPLAKGTARHRKGRLTLRLRLTKEARRGALSHRRSGLRLSLGTGKGRTDKFLPIGYLRPMPFKVAR
jgi:hypothetical protein